MCRELDKYTRVIQGVVCLFVPSWGENEGNFDKQKNL